LKKFLIGLGIFIILLGFKIYDSTLINMIRDGKIQDNGYGYNYLPDMVKVIKKENSGTKIKDKNKIIHEMVLTHFDEVEKVIYDSSERKYFVITENWALALKAYENSDFKEENLKYLSDYYNGEIMEIKYKDDEEIIFFHIVTEQIKKLENDIVLKDEEINGNKEINFTPKKNEIFINNKSNLLEDDKAYEQCLYDDGNYCKE
jgi:hypothetical protein